MDSELPKAYEPEKHEQEIYKRWEASGFFAPDKLAGEPYTIIMPPPNANGALHIGHALFVTIEDILIRYQRMRGKKALWLPGTDHAGFETQVVFEKKLDKEGRSRFKMTREEFFKECWDFVQANKQNSENGLRRLGASCDWSRNIFTLDPEIVKVVNDTFKRMYDDGLIYRGARICNWCPKHQTGLADLETKYEERQEPFYYFKYGPFVIGTSRPETKFGDKYVVMHPDDKRYAKYKEGEKINLEWINGPITATVIKDKAVDMEFGTGVMTITPAHDPVDFEIAERRKLDIEEVIDKRGKLLSIAGEFAGMKILEARPKIVEKLAAKGLVDHIDEKYKHNVQLCYKCGNLIEPQIVPQWYIKMTEPLRDGRPSLRDMAVQALDKGEVKIVTERFEKIFRHWMENLRDWPISRQIWWGIPIPVWYDSGGKIFLTKEITVILARHGETEMNAMKRVMGRTDASLSDKGREQADQLAQILSDRNIVKIICSNLKRSRETADIVAKKLQIHSVEVWPELVEVDFGSITGQTYDPAKSAFQRAQETETGETLDKLEQRVVKAVDKIRSLYVDGEVLIIGHNTFNRVIEAQLQGLSKDQYVNFREKAGILKNGNFVELKFLNEPHFDGLRQDPDTFDTWFSSGQWPYATLMANDAKRKKQGTKNKEQKSDFEMYFPTQVMETGWDILFFWVARMVMLSYYRTGKPPFEKVYLHGLVRDKDRQKMSKSKGNVIDPLGVIDTYGTDALRFALVFSTAAGNDIPLAEDKIKGMKHFANKLWNIARFIITNNEVHNSQPIVHSVVKPETEADKVVLSELEQTIKDVTDNLEAMRLHEAAQIIYDFTWHKLADVYLEASKTQLIDEALADNTKKILLHNLIMALKLLHPFMPFVTEHIWQLLGERKLVTGNLLMVEKWPKV